MTAIAARPGLPPGPRIPMPLQTVLFSFARQYLIPRWHQRFGDVFTLSLPGRRAVLLADPEDIKTVWNGAPSVFLAGEGNEIMRPVMGDESVLVLDGDAHLRARKLLMPAFVGAALRGYQEMFTEIATEQVRHWTPGTVALVPRMQTITLEVILRVVFGITDDAVLGELRSRLRHVVVTNPLIFLGALYPPLLKFPPWRGFQRNLHAVDALLYQEIARRRRHPVTDAKADVLSRLLAVQSAGSGAPLTDAELRDQLITLLLAGHETTSTALSWTLHELMRHPELMRRAVAAADGSAKEDDEYLEAVVKEALRLRPVVPQVARKLAEPAEVAGHLLPAGTVVAPSVLLVQHDSGQHERPFEYRPDRFLDGSVTTMNWFPFGGGVRRCIGASFSLTESVAVLRVLLREFTFTAPQAREERVTARNVTLVPSRGARAVVSRRAARPAP